MNLLAFFVALQSGFGLQTIGPIFFVWLSVFNLFVVSVFWSFMADVFPTDAARRLFGCISAGGSLGAMTGPFITAMAVKGVGVQGLLLVSGMFLLLAVGCIMALLKWYHAHHGIDLGNKHLSSAKDPDATPPSLWVGVIRIVRSPYLRGIALYLMCYSVLSTFLYSQQTILIPQVMPSSEDRMQLFASVWGGGHVGRDAHRVVDWVWGVWLGHHPAGIDWIWCAPAGRGIFNYQTDTRIAVYRGSP
jgi:AAA family ATP:ADP antiporter